MSSPLQTSVTVELPWTTRVMAILDNAAARVDRRTVLALLALIAAMLLWNRLRWFGGMLPEQGYPPEIWWSILCIEAVLNTLLVAAVLVADAAVDAGVSPAPAYAAAVLVSTALGAWLEPLVRHELGLRTRVDMPGISADDVRSHAWSLFVDVLQRSSLLVYVYVTQRMTAHARKRQQAAELARASARRRALESQLQAMQARVEPKFLLNTLAEVGRLYETDAVLGDAMLDDLITCLRAALPHLRESTSTLGKEAQLAGAYLNILRVSSEGRMAFAFDVPETVRGAHLPALVLLPLISQVLAARHGSANAGGRMDVVAHVAYGRLFLSIAGSGTDFVESKVDQELTDIQLRIRALYGGTASLRIEQVHPHGLVANLVIPCEGVAEGVSDAPLDARAAIS